LSEFSFGQIITSPSPLTIAPNASNVEAGDFVINWANTTDNILISVSLDYQVGATISFPTTTGLTLNTGYTSWTGISSVVFYGTKTNVNNALAAMTISTGSTQTAVKISVEATGYDVNYTYNPTNKHFYRYVAANPVGSISYSSAKTAAAGYTYKGKTGYLVTVTSDSENNFINNNITGANVWLAISDAVTDGTWIIDAGPESGTILKTQNGPTAGNIADQYNNWCSGEPNGANHSEDYAVGKWGGNTCWNDLPVSYGTVAGYVVEISDDFPAGSGYTDVYSSYIVHNNEFAYTLSSSSVLSSTNTSNYNNVMGGLQVNDGHTYTIPSATTFNSNKVVFKGTGKMVLTDATSKWTPGTPNSLNTLIFSPSTNSNPTYWATSSNWSGDTFYANAPYPSTINGYHMTAWSNSPQGWSAGANDANQWITLNYDVPAYIAGIIVQSRSLNNAQWVKTAHVDISTDGSNWTQILTNAAFNTNTTDALAVYFPTLTYAKYVRVRPTDWNNHITMRMGLIIKANEVITDGLVMNLDAGNLISYIGSGTTWNDLSGNGNHGTLSNSPTYNIDRNGYFTLNGSTQQASITDNATLEPGIGDWTMEAWFNTAINSSSQCILGKFNAGGASSAVSYSIRLSTSSLFAQMGDGSGNIVNSTNFAFAINTWYHVVYVYKGGATKTLQTFINGKSIGTVTHSFNSLLNSVNNLYIGSYNNREYAQGFNGKIGNIKLYKKALSTTEVSTNFNALRKRYGL